MRKSKVVIIDNTNEYAEILKSKISQYYNNEDIVVLSKFDEKYLEDNIVELLFIKDLSKDNKNFFLELGEKDIDIVIISNSEDDIPSSFTNIPLNVIKEEELDTRIYHMMRSIKLRKELTEATYVIQGESVKIEDIIYVEETKEKVYFICKGGIKLEEKLDFEELDLQLRKYYFIRCHQSFLVNAKYVEIIMGRDILLMNGEKLVINEVKLEEFYRKYRLYISDTSL